MTVPAKFDRNEQAKIAIGTMLSLKECVNYARRILSNEFKHNTFEHGFMTMLVNAYDTGRYGYAGFLLKKHGLRLNISVRCIEPIHHPSPYNDKYPMCKAHDLS